MHSRQLTNRNLAEMAVNRPEQSRASPIFERYILDVLERARRLIQRSRDNVAQSKKLEETTEHLLHESRERRKAS